MSDRASAEDGPPARPRRERSARYPGVPLADSIELCKFVDHKGLDGLSAEDFASALGYSNIKTNTFSARLSSARQFGLLALTGGGYGLTPLARSILHPVDPAELPRLYRKALAGPPLYADLAGRLGGKTLPDPPILANLLYHHYQIIAGAKDQAAQVFLESARFAGALGDDGVFRPDEGASESSRPAAVVAPPAGRRAEARPTPRTPAEVRIDLRLWGSDRGKVIRVRAPESISRDSLDRLLQALRLHVRVEEGPTTS